MVCHVFFNCSFYYRFVCKNNKFHNIIERSGPKKSGGAGQEEECQYPITDFKLKVKVIRAINLTPCQEKGKPKLQRQLYIILSSFHQF